MTERGVSAIITDRTLRRMPEAADRVNEMMRLRLEQDGCTNIRIEPPQFRHFEPDPDDPGADWEPYWGWEYFATGEKP